MCQLNMHHPRGLNSLGRFSYLTRHREMAGTGVGLAGRWCQGYFFDSLAYFLVVAIKLLQLLLMSPWRPKKRKCREGCSSWILPFFSQKNLPINPQAQPPPPKKINYSSISAKEALFNHIGLLAVRRVSSLYRSLSNPSFLCRVLLYIVHWFGGRIFFFL